MVPAAFYKIKIFPVVKKHLGGYILGPRIHLVLQVHEVTGQIGSFKMLLGISSNPDAEVRFTPIFYIFFDINTIVQVYHLFQQIQGVAVSIILRLKKCLIFSSIPAERQYVVDTKKIQVDKSISRSPLGNPAANKVRNSIHLVM